MDKLFDTFSTDDILKAVDGKVFWKGKPLSDEELGHLKGQAAEFEKSLLWKVLKSELQWFAIKNVLEKGKTAEDLRFAQLMGNLTDVIEKKLNTLSK